MITYENGKRVFIVRNSGSFAPIEGGGSFASELTYQSDTGKKSKYPTILIGVGDKVFVPGGKAHTKDLVYMSAVNRRALDPTFDYVAHSGRIDGVKGLMIRCVERKNKTP